VPENGESFVSRLADRFDGDPGASTGVFCDVLPPAADVFPCVAPLFHDKMLLKTDRERFLESWDMAGHSVNVEISFESELECELR